MKIKSFLNELYQRTELDDAHERRKILSDQMFEKEKSGLDCMSCTGRCCTSTSNSMQMTSIEALEALSLLESKNLLNSKTKQRLEDSVKDYRLDHLIQIGPNEYFRRTYTCPFYQYPEFGCGLGVDHKPYGCIAFNPCEPNQKDGGNCHSDLDIQKSRNEKYEVDEQLAIDYLEKEKGISSLKEPIPVKMLEIWNKLSI